MTALVIVGKVLKPRGLRGEIKTDIQCALDADSLIVGGKTFPLQKITPYKDFAYVQLEGITTAEQAERLRGATVQVRREQIVLEHDEVLTSELVGFTVVTDMGKTLGAVARIADYGAGAIIECAGFSFPYEDAFVIETDMSARRMTVRAKMLEAADAD